MPNWEGFYNRGEWTRMPSREQAEDHEPEESFGAEWRDPHSPEGVAEGHITGDTIEVDTEPLTLGTPSQPQLPPIPPESIRSFRVVARHDVRTRRNEDRWFVIGTHNGLYALQFGNEALITKHNPNKCTKCHQQAEEFETGGHRNLAYTVASMTDFGNGRYDRSSVHTAVPRNDGSRYNLPPAVLTVEETSNTMPWRTRFTNEQRIETEHDPRKCWECIMTVTRHADIVDRERRDITGHADGDMDLETGGFWFNDSFIRADFLFLYSKSIYDHPHFLSLLSYMLNTSFHT